jgi:DNA-directed RNA polymerase subunit RPC12/RpoP
MSITLTNTDLKNCESRIEKVWEKFNLLEKEIVEAAPRPLRKVVIQNAKCHYVPDYWNARGKKEKYKKAMWVGLAHSKFLRTIGKKRGNARYGIQFQFGIYQKGVAFNGIWIEGGSDAARSKRTAQLNLMQNRVLLSRILKRLPSSYYIYAKRKHEPLNTPMICKRVHRISEDELDDFLTYMRRADTDIMIADDVSNDYLFRVSKRGELPRYVIGTFLKLLPLYSLMIGESRTRAPTTPSSGRAHKRDVNAAEKEMKSRLSQPFQPFDRRKKVRAGTVRIARDVAFGKIIQEYYGNSCAVCGSKWVVKGQYEAEAAHIIPVRKNGSDDPRNGIALCRFHHWTFDKGIFTLTDDLEIRASPRTVEFSSKADQIMMLSGRKLALPETLKPSLRAVQWHRRHTFIQ